MTEILYGSKDFASRAWKEIEEGQPVVLRIGGWRKKFIGDFFSIYGQHDRLSREGTASRGQYFGMGWRSLVVPSFIGLCNHARSMGMSVAAYEKEKELEVRFEKKSVAT